MYATYKSITAEYILEHISQQEIFEFYLNIKVDLNKLFCSPLRKDSNPTCGFKYLKGGSLYMNDFSGHFKGGCFDLVMYMFNLSFTEALNKVHSDMQSRIKIPIIKQAYTAAQIQKEKTVIQVKRLEMSVTDLNYWKQFGIIPEILKKFKVTAAGGIWVNAKRVYINNPRNPAYIYDFDDEDYKIYFPTKSDFRFLTNTNKIQGWKQLPQKGEFLIITKSLKDVMVLALFRIPAIALQGEAIVPKEELIYELQKRFKTIVTLYDFDLAGIRTANAIKRLYGIKPYFLTNGRFGSINQGAKDAAEVVHHHGINRARTLINSLINDINEKTRPNNRDTRVHNSCEVVEPQESQVLYEGVRGPEEVQESTIRQKEQIGRPF